MIFELSLLWLYTNIYTIFNVPHNWYMTVALGALVFQNNAPNYKYVMT